LLAEYSSFVCTCLANGKLDERCRAVEMLTRAKAPPGPFARELVRAATSSSKKLREAAQPLVAELGEAAGPLLVSELRAADAEIRILAAQLLARIIGPAAKEILQEHATAESSSKVKQEIAHLVGNLSQPGQSLADRLADVDAMTEKQLDGTVSTDLLKTFRGVLERFNAYVEDNYRKWIARGAQGQLNAAELYSAADIDRLCEAFSSGMNPPISKDWPRWHHRFSFSNPTEHFAIMGPLVDHPELKPAQFIRAMLLLDYLSEYGQEGRIGFHLDSERLVDRYRVAHGSRLTLCDFERALERCGAPGRIIMDEILRNSPTPFKWKGDALWPYFINRLDWLEAQLDPHFGDYPSERRRKLKAVFFILEQFPEIPDALVARLWSVAMDTNRERQELAQPACEKLPDWRQRVTRELNSGSADARRIAAEWMGRRGERQTIEPLVAAAKSEKQDATKAAMLTALEAMGEPIEPFLDREKLHSEAVKNLKKGVPEALAWLLGKPLPNVHWRDTKHEVPTETITWLTVQSYKLKSPEAGPLLRRYCRMLGATKRSLKPG
jgi:hypothetical protein